MPVQKLHPNGAGTYTQWDTASNGGAHWEEVDETSHDGDTSYIADDGLFVPNGLGPQDSFVIDSWPHGNVFIEKVECIHYSKYVGGRGNSDQSLLLLDGTISTGAPSRLTTSWIKYSDEYAKPGGGNWLYTDFADLEIGMVSSARMAAFPFGNNVRCTQVYLLVTYSEDFGTIGSTSSIFYDFPTKHYFTNYQSDLHTEGAGSTSGIPLEKDLLDAPKEAGTAEVFAFYLEDLPLAVYSYTALGDIYNANWETGPLIVKQCFDNRFMENDIYMQVSGSRISSTGTVLETTDPSPLVNLRDGSTHDCFTFVVPEMNWSSGDLDDRLRISYKFSSPVRAVTGWMLTNDDECIVLSNISLHAIDTIESTSHIAAGAVRRNINIT